MSKQGKEEPHRVQSNMRVRRQHGEEAIHMGCQFMNKWEELPRGRDTPVQVAEQGWGEMASTQKGSPSQGADSQVEYRECECQGRHYQKSDCQSPSMI